MTNYEINGFVSQLKSGKRKNACLCIQELNIGFDDFWLNALTDQWGKAADLLLHNGKLSYISAVLADMIWEG